MNSKVRFHIEYSAIRYDGQQMLPQSSLTRSDAMFAILRHAGAIGSLMELVDETRINETDSDNLHLMMTNLGELLHLLTEAGIVILNEDDEMASIFQSQMSSMAAQAREV